MKYYIIDKDLLTIISGPHSLRSSEVVAATDGWNPDLISLADYGVVPEVRETLGVYQEYGSPVVTLSEVTLPAVDRSLADVKSEAQAQNKAECESRIFAVYPQGKQLSFAHGVYQGATAEAEYTAMLDDVASMVEEENRVFALIEAATDIAGVVAVKDPTWPTIGGA